MKSKETAHVNLTFLLTVIMYLSVSFGISFYQSAFEKSVPFPALILLSQFALFLFPFLYAVRSGHFAEKTGLRPISFGTVVLVVLMIICLEPLLTFVNALSQCFVESPTTDMIIEQATHYGFLQMFFLVALLPAFCEEIVYRGVFFQTYGKISVIPGALLSALLFGAMHGNLNQFAYAFLMGFAFALVVYATKSLFASMLMHLTVNGLSTILVFAMRESDALKEAVEQTDKVQMTVPYVLKNYGLIALFGTCLACVLFKAIAQKCGTWDDICKSFRAKNKFRMFLRLFTVPLVTALVVMMALMILSELVG